MLFVAVGLFAGLTWLRGHRWDEYANFTIFILAAEMQLVTSRDISFSVAGKSFALTAGESIHTENSHKFNRRTSNMLLLAGGWDPQTRWLDSEGRFSLLLAEARPNRSAP